MHKVSQLCRTFVTNTYAHHKPSLSLMSLNITNSCLKSMALGCFAAADPCMCERPFRLKYGGMWDEGRVLARERGRRCVENMFPPEAKDLWMLLCVFCTLLGCSLTVMDKTDVWHTSTSSWVCCSQKDYSLVQDWAGQRGAERNWRSLWNMRPGIRVSSVMCATAGPEFPHIHTPLMEKSYFMSFNAFLTLTS